MRAVVHMTDDLWEWLLKESNEHLMLPSEYVVKLLREVRSLPVVQHPHTPTPSATSSEDG